MTGNVTHHCETCGSEVSDKCAAHPDAFIVSILTVSTLADLPGEVECDDESEVCECCDGLGVIEVSRSGHPNDPDAWEIPCTECQEPNEPDPDALWDSRCDR